MVAPPCGHDATATARVAITPEVIVIGTRAKDDAKRREIMDKGAAINESLKGTLGDLLGLRFVETAPERVVAELTIRDELRTVGGALHGGTLMALADTVGAAATVLNLPPGAGTTTLESKTNFFAAGRAGVVRAEATALHRGRRTMVWQTRVVDESGRLLSMTIQTQMVLGPAV
jgi:1,4-dihydroxy-2-naphthoyl-CoA hydrolase